MVGVSPSGVKTSTSLSPLPTDLRHGLVPVVTLAFLSFVTSTVLFFLIGYRIIQWKRQKNSQPINQFVFLIFNLLFADIQQSIAFALNLRWLITNRIEDGNSTCWAQAWFVQNGDLASGVWCSAIGIHTCASVLWNYRLKPGPFYAVVALLWTFIFGCGFIMIAMHPDDIFVRAGVWCWVDAKYVGIRLWLHYFWIFVAEFGTVIVYGVLYAGLMARLRSNYYSAEERHHAKQAAWLMALYPAIYVACTLPLASARMMSLAGEPPSYTRLCIAGAMITSNGWLDVLVYTLTRRISLLGAEPPPESCGLDTFVLPFWGGGSDPRFGTVTTIEATGPLKPPVMPHERKHSLFKTHDLPDNPKRTSSRTSQQSMYGSMDGLFGAKPPKNGVHTETTVEVRSDPAEQHEMHAMHRGDYQERYHDHYDIEHQKDGSQSLRTTRRGSREEDGLFFHTMPPEYR